MIGIILPFIFPVLMLTYQYRDHKVGKIRKAIGKDLDALAEHQLRTATTDAEFKKAHVYWDAKMRAMWHNSEMAIKFWKPVESYYPPEVIQDILKFKEQQKSA